jgi:hypothetical protein
MRCQSRVSSFPPLGGFAWRILRGMEGGIGDEGGKSFILPGFGEGRTRISMTRASWCLFLFLSPFVSHLRFYHLIPRLFPSPSPRAAHHSFLVGSIQLHEDALSRILHGVQHGDVSSHYIHIYLGLRSALFFRFVHDAIGPNSASRFWFFSCDRPFPLLIIYPPRAEAIDSASDSESRTTRPGPTSRDPSSTCGPWGRTINS